MSAKLERPSLLNGLMREASNLVVAGSSFVASMKNKNVDNMTCNISCMFQISVRGGSSGVVNLSDVILLIFP